MSGSVKLIPSEHDFQQLFAEAAQRIGSQPVVDYLTHAAEECGWPIPAQDRVRIGFGVCLLVKEVESERSDGAA